MPRPHDQPSGSLAGPSGSAGATPGATDPLADVLRTVKLTGAQFFAVDSTSPWCVDIPPASAFAEIILPGARHMISYHIMVEGRCIAGVPSESSVTMESGDIIVFPHGDPYLMSSARGVEPELDRTETLQFFRDLAAGRLPFVVPEGGGRPPRSQFICGFLGCDLSPIDPLFATLPRLLHIRRPPGEPTDLLDRLIELALAEVRAERLGGESIRLGLCELMFVEVLRRHLETLSTDRTGWLAGLRDPVAGRALGLLHGEPARDWTLDSLARAAGASRTVLAERFARLVGEPPMRYLTMWRIQLAARLLTDRRDKVAAVAEQVGFASEAAFSRAFKKITGRSPAAWRREGRGGAGIRRG